VQPISTEMRPNSPSSALRFALLLVALTLLPGATSLGINGQLLGSRTLRFTPAKIRSLETIEPRTREILDQVHFQAITYVSDGMRIRGYLARPRDGTGLPCVIYNRGGNRAFGALDDAEALLSLGPIASQGYVVVASQYRGHTGAPGQDEFGGADVDDVLNLIPLLDALPDADSTRIGMVGWSRGGMMTYLALTRTDRIAAAIVGAGEANLIEAARRRPELGRVFSELIPNYGTDAEAELIARSAIRWPERLNKDTPLLVLHGGADWRVDPMQTLELAQKLYAARHPFRLVFFEGGDHGLTEYRGEVQRLVHSWLDHYVRDRAPFPDLEPHGS